MNPYNIAIQVGRAKSGAPLNFMLGLIDAQL